LESAVLALVESVTAKEPADTALESAVEVSVETLKAFESAVEARVLALSATLIVRLSSLSEFAPDEICALTAL
jgi:DNA-binding transcriptional regulator YbjK